MASIFDSARCRRFSSSETDRCILLTVARSRYARRSSSMVFSYLWNGGGLPALLESLRGQLSMSSFLHCNFFLSEGCSVRCPCCSISISACHFTGSSARLSGCSQLAGTAFSPLTAIASSTLGTSNSMTLCVPPRSELVRCFISHIDHWKVVVLPCLVRLRMVQILAMLLATKQGDVFGC